MARGVVASFVLLVSVVLARVAEGALSLGLAVESMKLLRPAPAS